MLIFEGLSDQILKAAVEVHKNLGPGFLEKVYENALVTELNSIGLEVETQKPLEVYYKGQVVGRYISDILVENKVLLEIKSVDQICTAHKQQLLNYLKATRFELGILMNFGTSRLEIKRVLNIKEQS